MKEKTFDTRLLGGKTLYRGAEKMESHESKNVDYILERLHCSDSIVLSRHKETYTCGRGKGSEIICASLLVSRRHCIFIRAGNGLNVTDIGSANGIYINGEKQKANMMVKLNENDIIGIGCTMTQEYDRTAFNYRLKVGRSDTSETNSTSPSGETTSNNVQKNTEVAIEPRPENIRRTNREKRKQPIACSTPQVPCKVTKLRSEENCSAALERVECNESIDIIKNDPLGTIQKSTDTLENKSSQGVEILADPELDTNTNSSTGQNNLIEHRAMPPPEIIQTNTTSSLRSSATATTSRPSLDKSNVQKNTEVAIKPRPENIVQSNKEKKKQTACSTPQMPCKVTKLRRENCSAALEQVRCNESIDVIQNEPLGAIKKSDTLETKSSEDVQMLADSELSNNKNSSSGQNNLIEHRAMPPPKIIQTNATSSLQSSATATTSRSSLDDKSSSKTKRVDLWNNRSFELPSPIKTTTRTMSTASTIKGKKMNHNLEPHLAVGFSQNEIITISDDEDDIFPSSQLFDASDSEPRSKLKTEIKEEDLERNVRDLYEEPYEEDCVFLSDSDGEVNPWLERLSRSQSQIMIDEDEEKSSLVEKDKRPLNLNLEDVDDVLEELISSLKEPEKEEHPRGSPIESDDDLESRNLYDRTHKDSSGDEEIRQPGTRTKIKKAQQIDRGKTVQEKKRDKSKRRVSVERTEQTEVDGVKRAVVEVGAREDLGRSRSRSSDEIGSTKDLTVNDHLNKFDLKYELIVKLNRLPSNVLKSSSAHEATSEEKYPEETSTRKRKNVTAPEIIEAPFLPKGEKRSVSCVVPKNVADEAFRVPTHARTSVDKSFDRQTSAETKKAGERKKLGKQLRRVKRRSTNNPPLIETKPSEKLSRSAKEAIKTDRREKLKSIAAKKKSDEKDSGTSSTRIIAKPRAKVTTKTRGFFLISDQEEEFFNGPSESSGQTDQVAAEAPTTSSVSTWDTVCTKDSGLQAPETMESVANNLRDTLNLKQSNEEVSNPERTESSIQNYSKTKAGSTKERKAVQTITEIPNQAPVSVVEESANTRQKENRSPNIAIKTSTQTSKKAVTFSKKLTEVYVYFIEPGNSLKKVVGKDAPIPRDKLPVRQHPQVIQCPKLEEFFLQVFQWNPVWLEEQKTLKMEPPVVKPDSIVQMPTKYNSYEEYYKIVLPLLLLELWHGITKEFENIDNTPKRPTTICSVVSNSITTAIVTNTNLRMTTMLLEVLVTREDVQIKAHPVYGDLVFLELTSSQDGKLRCHRVFAYITDVYQTIIKPNTYYNRDLVHYTKDPHTLLTYTVITKPLDCNIQVNRPQRLRTVAYLRSDMRMVQALQYLPQSPLMDLILNPRTESYQLPVVPNLEKYPLVTKDKLNLKQLEAVVRITESVLQKQAKICLVRGPPGTGKSMTIINMIIQILYGQNRYRKKNSSLRILVCAPSNAAIDEIVMRLLSIRPTFPRGERFKMVRVGRPETMHPQVRDISLAELSKRDVKKTAATLGTVETIRKKDEMEEEKKFLQARINALNCELQSTQHVDDNHVKYVKMKLADATAKYRMLENWKPINEMDRREFTKLQRAAENTMLAGADVIACTLSSCYTNNMESIFGGNKQRISVCIVDEATQSCEAETLIPLMLGVNTLVLIGDPNQLPATVISQRAKKLGLDQSLFSRVQSIFDGQKDDPIIMLDTQYRMSYAIACWPNKYFYDGKLRTNVASIGQFPFESYRVLDINAIQDKNKFSNGKEAEFVTNLTIAIITKLETCKWRRETPITIGIITPYNNQKALIQGKIVERMSALSEDTRKKVVTEVNTVDSFQGQERDVIIMSCVRSHGIGFLSDRQRLCVALTRAKYSLILCGNFSTFKKDSMWNALLADARTRKAHFYLKANAESKEIANYICK